MQPIDTFAVRACIGQAPFLQLLVSRFESAAVVVARRGRTPPLLLLRAAARDFRRSQLRRFCSCSRIAL
jgi:hypothetical protein